MSWQHKLRWSCLLRSKFSPKFDTLIQNFQNHKNHFVVKDQDHHNRQKLPSYRGWPWGSPSRWTMHGRRGSLISQVLMYSLLGMDVFQDISISPHLRLLPTLVNLDCTKTSPKAKNMNGNREIFPLFKSNSTLCPLTQSHS